MRGNAAEESSETSRKEKTFTEDADGNRFAQIKEWKRSGASPETLVSTETYAYGDCGEMLVGRSSGGVSEYSATRVSSGNGLGKIATETDRAGTTRSRAYDAQGRVTLSRGFADLSETTEYSYAAAVSGEFADLRPRTAVHKIAGTVFRTETFSYDDDFANGRSETRSVTANGETLTTRTVYYSSNTGTVGAGRVKLEIRADGTATHHEYSAVSIPATVGMSSNLGYTETVTEGVFEDGEFSCVSGKSTRRIRTFDTRGNETRTEEHVLTGTAFELVSWENRTYSPAHKVIATTRSDGKTTSADYICTGAVWTIDENGVRTDNTFDSAKRLSTSTRRGARGNVVTSYGYDAEDRVISETETSGALTRTRSRAYNALGELVSETDALGNATSHSVSADGLTETTALPDGGTRITARNADGSLASETGTAVVAKHYSYAFDATNGLKVTTVFTGSANSAQREKTYVDGHGRTVKTERPGFGANAVLTTRNTYSGTRLVGVSETGQPQTAYAHDALGNVISTTRSVIETPGAELSSWRKTETETVFEKDVDGVIWRKTTNSVSCSGASIPAQTSVSRTRLSGLSLSLESEQISIDARGNATTTSSAYAVSTKTRTRTTAFPQMSGVQTSVFIDGALVSQTPPSGASASSAYDAFGRETSATLKRGSSFLGLFSQSRDAATGRLSGAVYGGVEFAYSYLSGTDLISEIAVMNGSALTKTVSYASDRDLPSEIAYKKSDGSLIAKRSYSYDALSRVSSRVQTRGNGESAVSRADAFGYNARSELTSATLGSDEYSYAFDAIGNRETSSEPGTALAYASNALNQYTSYGRSGVSPLSPDAGTQNNSSSQSDSLSPQAGRSDNPVASAVQLGIQNDSSSQSDVPAPQGITPQSASSSEATGVSLLPFTPTYDADGNMTTIETSTDTWMKNRTPQLVDGGIVKTVSCTRG